MVIKLLFKYFLSIKDNFQHVSKHIAVVIVIWKITVFSVTVLLILFLFLLFSVHYFSPVAVLSINTLLLLLLAKAFSLSDELWYMQQKFLIRFDRLILQVHTD